MKRTCDVCDPMWIKCTKWIKSQVDQVHGRGLVTNAASPTPGHQRPCHQRLAINARSPNASPPAREESTRMKCSHEVLAPARPAHDSTGVRVCGSIARHPARRVGHEAGVGRVFAALREVPAQAGLKHSAGVVLFVSAAAGQVVPPNEIQHVGGERVERDHGSAMAGGLDWTGGLVDWWTGGLVDWW